MNSRWSWIFIISFLMRSVHCIDLSSRDESSKERLALTIVGGITGAVCIVVLVLVLYVQNRRPHHFTNLEDGLDSPESSSRQWFSRFGRYRRDGKSQSPSVCSSVFSEKDSVYFKEKPSPIPRHIRISSAFTRELPRATSPKAFVDRPLPSTPTPPRSAHVHDGKRGVKMFVVSPPSAPLSHTERMDQRKVQVSPRPAAPSPLGHGRRKRDILPSLFRFTGKQSAPPAGGRNQLRLPARLADKSPEELARQMQEKQRAVAVLEAKSRVHKHHAHSSSTTSLTCEVDEKIQSDLAGLRHEVTALNKLIPKGASPKLNSAF